LSKAAGGGIFGGILEYLENKTFNKQLIKILVRV